MPQSESERRFHSKKSKLEIWDHEGTLFKKIDSNTKNNLEGAKFSISSLNNKVQIEVTQNYNDGVYEIPNQSIESQYQDLIQFLPSDIVNELNQINSYNELQLYAQNHGYNIWQACTWDEGYCSYIGFEIPVKLKEVRSPIGYQKTDYIIPAYTIIYFNFEDGSDVVNNKQVVIDVETYTLYQYNNQISVTQYFEHVSDTTEEYSDLVELLNSNNLEDFLESNNYYSYECDGVYYNKYSEQSNYCDVYYPLVEDDVGEVVLRLDDTIEGKKEYNTTDNTKATYKIHAINSGTASSGNNQVSITIPKELTIETTSISNKGVYNSDNRQITWTIDYLDNEIDEELTFNIIIPSGTEGSFKLSSQITNGQDATTIAEDTIINVNNEVINPKTGTGNYLLFILVVLIISSALYLNLRKKKKYIMK